MKQLPDNIDALYAAFRDVPKPGEIEGCPCCIADKEICTLLSKPLREIAGGELASYASSAFLTVGAEADYLYFLPRILEVSCMEAGWWPDIEITGRAVGQTRPASWPAHQRDALVGVFEAVLQKAISQREGWAIDGWVCAIAKTGLPLGAFLAQIERSTDSVLAYYERNAQTLMKRKLGNAFWDRGDPGYQEVMEWFLSPKLSKIILDGYGLTPTHSEPDAGG